MRKIIIYISLLLVAMVTDSCKDKAEIIEPSGQEEAEPQTDLSEQNGAEPQAGSSGENEAEPQEDSSGENEAEPQAGSSDDREMLAVHVCGAVVSPGVYYLVPGSIRQDALIAAGGFDEGAADAYVNLAQEIHDGEKIYFPYEDELEGNMAVSDDAGENDTDSGKVNINTADAELLMTLPGIGETRADAIVKYREEHGEFKDIADICNVSGIKTGTYDRIKEYIVVN